jgi:hypothetical protein
MTDVFFLVIDFLALLIEWTLRLIFWLGRKLGWIKQTTPKPTRKQTLIGAIVLLAILLTIGLLQ